MGGGVSAFRGILQILDIRPRQCRQFRQAVLYQVHQEFGSGEWWIIIALADLFQHSHAALGKQIIGVGQKVIGSKRFDAICLKRVRWKILVVFRHDNLGRAFYGSRQNMPVVFIRKSQARDEGRVAGDKAFIRPASQ